MKELHQQRKIISLIEWLENLNQKKLLLSKTELIALKNNPLEPKTKQILFEHLKNQGIEVDLNDNLK
ncbi:hypothetical protein [[Mycoplasma] cavipharyngis]|uniref:hypothetical protein n=1 Tax=[Mycoplasma] cavipharyngis TaxID=92757 RepID=UPI003703D21B